MCIVIDLNSKLRLFNLYARRVPCFFFFFCIFECVLLLEVKKKIDNYCLKK